MKFVTLSVILTLRGEGGSGRDVKFGASEKPFYFYPEGFLVKVRLFIYCIKLIISDRRLAVAWDWLS